MFSLKINKLFECAIKFWFCRYGNLNVNFDNGQHQEDKFISEDFGDEYGIEEEDCDDMLSFHGDFVEEDNILTPHHEFNCYFDNEEDKTKLEILLKSYKNIVE